MRLGAAYLASLNETTRRYHRTMQRIHEALGGKCQLCGSRDDLEIDHPNGRDWEPRKLSAHCRAKRYLVELMSGIELRLLCATCNGRDGSLRMWGTRAGTVDPQEHNSSRREVQ